MPDGLNSFASLFADDLKLVIRTMNHNETQCDIEKLNQWQKQWLLKFNVDEGKCKVLHIGKNIPRLDYFMDGKLLPSVEFEKDLGLNITENLQWDMHIKKSVNKAKSVIGWIKRSLISRNRLVMINAYKTLVRPHIEYAVQLWNLSTVHGNWNIIMELEDVQRSFTRLVKGIGLLPYKDRLKELQLTILLERRMRGEIIETFKIISG